MTNIWMVRVWGPIGVDRLMVCDAEATADATIAWDKKKHPGTSEGAYEKTEVTLWTMEDQRLTEIKNG